MSAIHTILVTLSPPISQLKRNIIMKLSPFERDFVRFYTFFGLHKQKATDYFEYLNTKQAG